MEFSESIKRKSLAEEVAERIAEQINSGKLTAGEKLPNESELMRAFGVGRSTIREAVRMLANMGYLSVQQGRGTFVKDLAKVSMFNERLKRADIQDLREVRSILESSIARLAAYRRTDIDMAQIKLHAAQRAAAAEAGDIGNCIVADINFHNAVTQATHNEILAGIYQGISEYLSQGFEYIYDDTSFFIASQPLHDNLLQHIENQDGAAAAQAAQLLWSEALPQK